MKNDNSKIEEEKILTITVRVKDKLEAYEVVSELGFYYDVVGADFNGQGEKFDEKNTSAHFLRDNSKIKKTFRDIRAERLMNKKI